MSTLHDMLCGKTKQLKSWELHRRNSERERGRERERTRDRDTHRKRERVETAGAGCRRQNNYIVFGWFFVGDCFYKNNIALFCKRISLFLKRNISDKPFFRFLRHTVVVGIRSSGRTFLTAVYAISVRI